MADDLSRKINDLLLEKRREWYELPRVLGGLRLVQIRNELREQNLLDTEEPPLEKKEIPANLDPALRQGRTSDGTYNDLHYPKMGSVGCRFGRNVPLQHAFPDTPNLLIPNPRVVSRELMTRDEFKPAAILNLLAAAWIQFQVHDWFVHERSKTDFVDIPTAAGDNWGASSIRVPRSVPSPAPAGSKRPPAYANLNSHWWDASQIYGGDADVAAKLRTKIGGKLKIEPTGLLPVDPATGVHFSGFTDNWWLGLALLHTLFTLEHNHICDLLAHAHQDYTDDQLYTKARLINSALMAKIHSLEWTLAILPHPLTVRGLHYNWHGVVDEENDQLAELVDDKEALGGIIGSQANHYSAPYSLTEEFVSVYRMHPLMPDDYKFYSLTTGRFLEDKKLPEIAGMQTPAITERITMPDLFYSFGIAHPGALTLHNYPRHLQDLTLDNGERLDLAAVDIFRDRERGVPRYNMFRRLMHKKELKSFDELTEDATWRKQLKTVYGDIDKVDLMTGLYAEKLPEQFGFSDTAFRVFILMATRRLKSDRFFTDDFTDDIYTELGREYVKRTTMKAVLLRHYPHLAPALEGKENAFAPWNTIKGPTT